MFKKSLAHISLVGGGNIGNAFLGLLFFAVINKNLTPEDFGKYALLTNLLVFLSKVTDFGTNSTYVSKSITNQHQDIAVLQRTKAMLFAIALPITFGALWWFELFTWELYALFAIGLLAYTINNTLFPIFQRNQEFTYAVLINTLPALTKTIFAGLIALKFLYITEITALWIFALSMFACSILIPLTKKTEIKDTATTSNATYTTEFAMLKTSAPAGISILIKEGWSTIANTLANSLGGFVNVGVYALADKISTIFALISLSIFTVLLPKNANRKKDSQAYDYKETFLIALLVIILAIIASFVSTPFVITVFGSDYAQSATILNILIFSSALMAIHNFVENYFFVEDKTKTMLGINISRLLVFVTTAIVATNAIGLEGIAYAQLFAGLYAVCATTYIITRKSVKG